MSQYIQLKEITTGSAANPVAPMTPADLLAVKIPSLMLAFSARDPGLDSKIKRDRLTGQLLPQTSEPPLVVGAGGGKAMWTTSSPSGPGIGRGSIRLKKYDPYKMCMVLVAYVGGDFLTTGGWYAPTSLLQSDGKFAHWFIRYFSPLDSSGKAGTWGVSNLAGPASALDPNPSAPGWRVIRADLHRTDLASDAVSSRIQLNGTINSAISSSTGWRASGLLNDPSCEIGSQTQGVLQVGCGIGEIYQFNNCVQADSNFSLQVDALVAALKTQYGIA